MAASPGQPKTERSRRRKEEKGKREGRTCPRRSVQNDSLGRADADVVEELRMGQRKLDCLLYLLQTTEEEENGNHSDEEEESSFLVSTPAFFTMPLVQTDIDMVRREREEDIRTRCLGVEEFLRGGACVQTRQHPTAACTAQGPSQPDTYCREARVYRKM